MSRPRPLCSVVLTFVLLVLPASAQRRERNAASAAPAAAKGADFTAFRSVPDLNIFDSSRYDRSRSPSSGDGPAAPASQTITLVGTMDYAKGFFAFFDSSESAYRRVLPVGASIADFKITRIERDAVEFVRGDTVSRLRVAQQFRRADGADWTIADAPTPAPAPAGASVAAPDAAARPAASVPANASETLLRLMEQRRKQLQNP